MNISSTDDTFLSYFHRAYLGKSEANVSRANLMARPHYGFDNPSFPKINK